MTGAARRETVALPRPVLEASEVSCAFGPRLVLSGVTFSASLGEVVGVTGVSGAGKTTLLRLLHGEIRPNGGRLWLAGRPLHRRWLRGTGDVFRRTGFIFQDARLLPRLTALENVLYGLQLARPDVPQAIKRRAALEALEALGLAALGQQFPAQLSAGERQRVAVARAVAAQPQLILADEPVASQDEASADLVMRMLFEAARAGSLVVVASHDVVSGASALVNLPRLDAPERPRRRLSVPRRIPRRKAGPT